MRTVGYVYLLLAIGLELIGTTCMKLSHGFSNLAYGAGTLVAYGLCFFFLSLCLEKIPLGIAYATWGGVGILAVTAISYFWFHEPLTPAGIIGILMIAAGTVLCNCFGTVGHG